MERPQYKVPCNYLTLSRSPKQSADGYYRPKAIDHPDVRAIMASMSTVNKFKAVAGAARILLACGGQVPRTPAPDPQYWTVNDRSALTHLIVAELVTGIRLTADDLPPQLRTSTSMPTHPKLWDELYISIRDVRGLPLPAGITPKFNKHSAPPYVLALLISPQLDFFAPDLMQFVMQGLLDDQSTAMKQKWRELANAWARTRLLRGITWLKHTEHDVLKLAAGEPPKLSQFQFAIPAHTDVLWQDQYEKLGFNRTTNGTRENSGTRRKFDFYQDTNAATLDTTYSAYVSSQWHAKPRTGILFKVSAAFWIGGWDDPFRWSQDALSLLKIYFANTGSWAVRQAYSERLTRSMERER
jgi:hypothetical protein